MPFKNCYEDVARAEAYAKLEFAGTYYLAYRDLPAIIGAPPPGARALDFGCGAGRSTRFLRRLGFEVVAAYDLVLCAFTFDNVATRDEKVALLQGLTGLLRRGGKIVNVVSSPEICQHEWASFSTHDFPENARAESGQVVRIVLLDHEDHRAVEDVLWTAEPYAEVNRAAGLEVVAGHEPLASGDEPYRWINETRIAPWAIYLLRPSDLARSAVLIDSA